MKRLCSTIGLSYLTVLTVAFFLPPTNPFCLASGFAAAICGLILLLKRIKIGKTILIVGLTTVLAVCSLFLYQNNIYRPVIDDYSDKEIYFKGYICDEIQIVGKTTVIPLQTEEIDGKQAAVRIHLTMYAEEDDVEEFDCVEGKLLPYAHQNQNLISKGCFLLASRFDGSELHATGEKHLSLYRFAVQVRLTCKHALTKLLNRDSSALCKAILLGDKTALRQSYRHDFERTGTSFLIVVSGFHLSVICWLIKLLLSHTRIPNLPACLILILAVISFAAVTGFPRSIIRAGIIVILTYSGEVIHRKSDGINSLGLAAIVLALPNPFIVGDVGVLLSFTSTLGIMLWAPAIVGFLTRILHIRSLKGALFQKIALGFINLAAVSLSAALWVLPILALFFEQIPTLVILASIITSPLACLILILTIVTVILYTVPFLSMTVKPLTVILHMICDTLLHINASISSVPFASVQARAGYWWIWIAATAVLVAVGYIIHAQKKYIIVSVITSLSVLATGWSVQILTDSHPTEVYINQNYRGLTVSVSKNNRLSLIACGGNGIYNENVIDALYAKNNVINYLVIPNHVNYSSYGMLLEEQFDLQNIVIHEDYSNQIPLDADFCMPNNSRVSLQLNSDTLDEVIHINHIMYQYLTIGNTTLLFVPHYGDISQLPEIYRTADYVIMDYVSYHAEALQCHVLLYTGQQNERYQKNAGLLRKISDEIHLLSNESYTLKIDEGR